MGLREYHRKRKFDRTPEPRGQDVDDTAAAATAAGGRSFVIQKHAASRLHYDFRLELEGVLKSWAVPKGPSFDPVVKRLAMHVEDHPVEYGGFEGIIPKGEYGGGTVLLWDEGVWEPVGDPHKTYRSGNLKFHLHGKKLRGGWALVKLRSRKPGDDRSWLLVKERDQEARPEAELDITASRPESVATGRGLDEIAAAKSRVWHSKRASVSPSAIPGAEKWAGRGPMPASLRPALAAAARSVPAGDQWLHEIAYDGERILGRVVEGKVILRDAKGVDWTRRLAPVAEAARELAARTAILDGHVGVLQADGTTNRRALAADAPPGPLVYFVFDLLFLDGWDLRGAALAERKKALQALLATGGGDTSAARYVDHVQGGGQDFLNAARALGLRAIISKRRDLPHHPGRSRDWLKVAL